MSFYNSPEAWAGRAIAAAVALVGAALVAVPIYLLNAHNAAKDQAAQQEASAAAAKAAKEAAEPKVIMVPLFAPEKK